jgi:hypothetical protein
MLAPFRMPVCTNEITGSTADRVLLLLLHGLPLPIHLDMEVLPSGHVPSSLIDCR